MTDIDFDELDKAVNSVMGTKSLGSTATDEKAAVPDNASSEVTTEAVASEVAVENPVIDTPTAPEVSELAVEVTPEIVETVSETAVETATPVAAAPTIVAKKRGQFMDMIHPSANMRSRPDPVPAARRNVALKPSAAFEKDFTETAATPASTESAETTPAANEWPDSIELAPTSVPQEAPAAPDTLEPEEQSPLVSPFLPDAKPEKRPLGGLSSSAAIDESVQFEAPDETAEATVDESLDETQLGNTSLMPEELSSDIMNVESGNMPPQASASAAMPVQPITETADDSAVVGPSSIPQQYQTSELSASDTEHASLYDTGAQSEVTHAAKKRSGWLVPLVIILLLILGGAGGYFAYTMNLFS